MSRRRRRQDEEDINLDSWLATYSDTITLLLTFFILLYSISVVDSQKLNELSNALQQSLKGNAKVTELESLDDLEFQQGNSEYEDLYEKLENIIQSNNLTDVIKIREEDRGIILQLDETILFDSGKADLKGYSTEILDQMTSIIESVDNDILVEGNADNVPMYSEKFKSNWELSTERAVNVVKYFVSTKNIDPTRFSVKGYGEYNPLAPNDTAENRAINRRVDILIVEQKEKQE